ncbi:MAG: gluconokinase, partial [Pseudomonadota bacterium]|nr:gluconokinase [Pseudomonadota bacterium]
AAACGLHFIDGDALHSAESVARMQAGIALGDEDRWPWLDRIGSCLADASNWPRGVVVACSALRRAYRDRLRSAAPGVRFVFLDGPDALIALRLAARGGHYMPASLLASQLETLERPGDDESDVVRVSIELPVGEVVRRALLALLQPAP